MRRIAESLFYWKFLYRAGLILLVASAPVFGAGIAVMEHSVKELGQAFSGAPTNTSDGSMVFFNPAAMSQVRGKLISAASYYIVPSVTFHDSASRLGSAPLTGGDGGDSGRSVFIPNFYYVQELSNRVAFGFGFNLPYGMRNSYDSDWKGRYQAIDSEVLTINFNPSLSFKLTEKFSLGAGFNVQYLRSKLTNAIDLGPACFLLQGALPCLSQGIAPQAADGHVSLKGDSVGFGYNLGAFYTLTPDARFGVSYRSRIAHDVKGDANFTLPDKAIALTQGIFWWIRMRLRR